jgi:hypothetical protein
MTWPMGTFALLQRRLSGVQNALPSDDGQGVHVGRHGVDRLVSLDPP